MNFDDTVNEVMQIAKNVKYADQDGYGYKESYFEDQIKKVIVKALVAQSQDCLDAIYKYKNQWDKTKPYGLIGDEPSSTDRVIQLIVNMSTDEIKEMMSTLLEA